MFDSFANIERHVIVPNGEEPYKCKHKFLSFLGTKGLTEEEHCEYKYCGKGFSCLKYKNNPYGGRCYEYEEYVKAFKF